MEKSLLSLFLAANAPRENAPQPLEETLALASVGIAALRMLETLLPAAAVHVEDASTAVTTHFTRLAELQNSQNKIIERMLDAMGDNAAAQTLREETQTIQIESAARMAGIVIAMQFQDRNTQIAGNAARLVKEYANMLAEMRERTAHAAHNGPAVEVNATQAARTLLAGISISDMRRHFINALGDVNLQCDPTSSCSEDDDNKDIELF